MLFIGDDWAEDHHDVELQDETGRRLERVRLPEGMAGISRLHAMVGRHAGDAEDVQVVVGIETDRGMWVQALVAAGYQVYPVNPLQAARFRERLGVSGAKSDPGDAHTLADVVRTERHQLRPIAGDSDTAAAVKVAARAHKSLIWERTRHLARLRHALLDFFPAALAAFDDLDAPDVLELLGKASDPDAAARLSRAQVRAALKRARRRDVDAKTERILAVLRAPQLRQPAPVTAAYAASVRAQVAILTALNTQIQAMQAQVDAHFGQHPDVEIYRSQPGLGVILGARVLAEFGDDPDRYAEAKARKNYAGTSPITRQSGKMRLIRARYVHNDRLRPSTRPRGQSPRRAAPAGQPARRDPPRLPQDPHLLRRGHRLARAGHRRPTTGRVTAAATTSEPRPRQRGQRRAPSGTCILSPG